MDTPILDLASPPRYDYPPPFSSLGYDLPIYARTAAADERVLISEPVASHATSAAPREYVYETKRLRLNLGPKTRPIQAPCYGWNATVEGYVDVPGLARAQAVRLTVTLQGYATSTVVDRGMSICTSAKTVLYSLNTMWKSPDPLPTETRFPFSFSLPSYIRSTKTPLPPSYATVMPGLAAECRYTIRVDLYRKGLHRHKSIKAMILYLPRTTPPAPPIPGSPSPPSSPIDEGDRIKWKTVQISPVPPSTDKENGSMSSLSETVDPKYIIKFTLPEPLVYASASTIPFTIRLRADSPVVPYLFSNLDVYILKQTTVFSGSYYGVRDGIIGKAELHKVDDEPPESSAEGEGAVGWKVFQGSVTSVREGGETSWEVPSVINMKYCIAIRIRPSTAQPTASPRYSHNEPIKMVTHPRLPHDHYAHDPVLGLIAVPGSSGTRIRRC